MQIPSKMDAKGRTGEKGSSNGEHPQCLLPGNNPELLKRKHWLAIRWLCMLAALFYCGSHVLPEEIITLASLA